ncbi:hypothetical protein AAGS61_19030 [Lysinibacillus sp. KU-BSD001]|uniref:hypothetical protein n=1 Tax=Lysinibacillus sp. KU-BSD001 TaxID=3141328 RepID=UPI0036E1B49D
MNKFDERYEIRLAEYDDIEMIMQFIDNHWRKNHIMATNRELFEYEYVENNQVNFVLAIDKKVNRLEGIFGFIYTSKTLNAAKKCIWGSMWKVVEEHNNMPFLGIELAKRAKILTNCDRHIGNGANPKTTIPLRKVFFREYTDKMDHYYMLNPDIKEYKISKIQNNVQDNKKNDVNFSSELVKLNSIEELLAVFDVEKVEAIPYKDNYYINKRYFKHPIYEYKVYGVKRLNEEVNAILVCREVQCSGAKILRIMDYIGEERLLEGLSKELSMLLSQGNYEYIDFYAYNFNSQFILNAGFMLREEKDPNIIPNYFEPFLQENVDIWVHYKEPGTKFFKADGDQDRPNELREEN